MCQKNIDWTERDEDLLAKLKFVVENELQPLSRPIRITKTRLGYATGALHIFRKRIEYLPKCKNYLTQAIETRDDYRKRKLIWAAIYLNNNNEPIVMWKLMKVAGIPDRMWEQYWNLFEKYQQNIETYDM